MTSRCATCGFELNPSEIEAARSTSGRAQHSKSSAGIASHPIVVEDFDPVEDTPEATHQTLEEYERANESRTWSALVETDDATYYGDPDSLADEDTIRVPKDPEYADVDDDSRIERQCVCGRLTLSPDGVCGFCPADRPTDPEYADVDDAGQLSIGVAGEQRALDGLAPPKVFDHACERCDRTYYSADGHTGFCPTCTAIATA